MTARLLDEIVAEIRARGPLSFADFMARALYDPASGYYSGATPRTGWRGHYVTSPEIDPIFGHLWAKAVADVWRACGTPSDLRVVELGPGEGGFAEALIEGLRADGSVRRFTYTVVERTEAGSTRVMERLGHDDRVGLVADIEHLSPAPGVLFAHEVLDNVPVHLIERRGDHHVELVVTEDAGRLSFTSIPLPQHFEDDVRHLALRDGARAEISPGRSALVKDCLAAIESGTVVFIDYGLERDGWQDRPGGTVTCYSETGADDDPLSRPGEKDITSHVDWSAVTNDIERAGARPFGPFLQRDVLRVLGARAADDALRADHMEAIAQRRGADAVRALSRRQALGALLDRGGLGGLQIVIGVKNLEAPAFCLALEDAVQSG